MRPGSGTSGRKELLQTLPPMHAHETKDSVQGQRGFVHSVFRSVSASNALDDRSSNTAAGFKGALLGSAAQKVHLRERTGLCPPGRREVFC
jgi:hypothetical protein